MAASDITLEEQQAILKPYREYLLAESFFAAATDAVTPQGDAFCMLETYGVPLKACLACPTSQVFTLDVVAEGEDFSRIDREAASQFCAKINQAFPFQNLMLVVDYGHILSETKILRTAPPEGLGVCVQDLINLTSSVRAAAKHLSVSDEAVTEERIDALCQLVLMNYQAG